MAHVHKTTEELIADEEKKSDQVKARISELKSRQRVEERKKDNHRKIVVGAAVIAHIKIDRAVPQGGARGIEHSRDRSEA